MAIAKMSFRRQPNLASISTKNETPATPAVSDWDERIVRRSDNAEGAYNDWLNPGSSCGNRNALGMQFGQDIQCSRKLCRHIARAALFDVPRHFLAIPLKRPMAHHNRKIREALSHALADIVNLSHSA